jgi:hypothetical protein
LFKSLIFNLSDGHQPIPASEFDGIFDGAFQTSVSASENHRQTEAERMTVFSSAIRR